MQIQTQTSSRMKPAIAGGFSGYTCKGPRDFIYERNNERAIFFASGVEETARILMEALGR